RCIGLEYVRQLSSDSDNTVFALARDPSSASSLAALAKERKNISIIKADVSDLDQIAQAAKEVEAQLNGKGLDILVNNAGITGTPQGADVMTFPFTSNTAEAFTEAFRVNVVGPIETTKAFLPLLRKGVDKKIVFISSNLGLQYKVGTPLDFDANKVGMSGPYSVSKTALNMASHKLAVELGKEGFIVFLLHPGWVSFVLPSIST
ncbi:NAD(P)-binding protein, partial [Atractiella rhizophila]